MINKFKGVIIIIFLLGILMVSFFGRILDAMTIHVYNFETQNGNFKDVVIPAKGRDFERMEHNFALYKQHNPSTADTVLYRTFRPNYVKFWLWHKYATNEVYSYKFKN